MDLVTTDAGTVRGVVEHGVASFRGVPYARAARFEAPSPPTPWAGVRDAGRPGPACPQPDGALGRLAEGTDEDCLVLNIWAPAGGPVERPVLVFLHGGAFTTGSGALGWYAGAALARRGAVVVTVNYRLGALGWLHLEGVPGAPPGAGNLGLSDQVAALRWVRRHAERFGGDPERVCLVGQSAGAMSVATLLGRSDVAGLVRRAVCQSGAQAHVRTPEAASEVTAEVLAALGLQAPTVGELRRVPVGALLDAQVRVTAARRPHGGLPFGPVLDGAVLTEHPAAAVEAGSASGVDLLCGVTAEEMRFYSAFGRRDLTEDRFEARISSLVAAAGHPHSPELVHQLADGYRRTVPEASPADRWDLLQSDHVFGLPAARLVDRQSGHAPSWSYLFSYRGAGLDGRFGSCHALDLPFVFDTLDAPGVEVLVGPVGPDERSLARAMADAWVAFAAIGDPRCDDRLEPWASATGPGPGRAHAVFDRVPVVALDPLRSRHRLWPEALVA
jgi:para-nitrobenzyl esterase